MEDEPRKPTKAEQAFALMQGVILLYSAASAAQGLFRMTQEGFNILESKFAARKIDEELKKL